MEEMFGGIHFSYGPDPDNITKMDMNCLGMIHDFHRHGIRLDVPFLHSLNSKIQGIQEEIEIETNIYIGDYQYRNPTKGSLEPFKIGSRDHLAQLLFEHLKIQGDSPVPMTPSGKRFEVSEEIMEPYKDKHPIVPGLIEWHKVEKLRNTYAATLPLLVDSESRVHTQFNATIAATGRLSSSNPNCFDEETEVLTPEGWKRLGLLRQQSNPDEVAQWDNGKISFVIPTGYTFGASPELVEITNTHIDLKTTADHRCLLRNRKTGELRVFEASKYPEDWEQIQAGHYSGDGSKLSDDEIRFMLALQADGSWCGDRHAVTFTFKKKRKIDRMRELLKSLGVVHSYNGKSANGRHSFYLPSCEATEKQFQLIGQKKLLQYSILLSLSSHQLSVFTDEVMFWDGCWTRKNHYACKEKHNTEVVATAFTLSGRRARVRKYVNQRGCVSWQADVTNRDYSLTTNRNKKNSKRGGFIYCVSVPSSYLLVRRNGCVMVTGNCQNIPIRSALGKEIRRAFVAPSGWDLVSLDLSQIEMVWAAHRSQDSTMLNVFRTGEDIHDRTTCNVFGYDYAEVAALKKLCKSGLATPAQVAEFRDYTQFKRLPCKTVGFGVLYGQTAEGLQKSLASEGVFWTLEQCQYLIDVQFFGVYPNLKKMLEEDFRFVRRYAMICCAFGRARLVPEAKSQIRRIMNEGIRKAGNHPEQASAQGTIKIAMARIMPLCRKLGEKIVKPLLQIHDELIFQVVKSFSVEFAELARLEMEAATPLSIPVRSSSDIAERWGDFK